MSDQSLPRKFFKKRLAWLVGFACLVCCTLPLIAIAMGSTALVAFAVHLERAGIAIGAIGAILFLYILFVRRKGASCSVNCGCRPESTRAKNE